MAFLAAWAALGGVSPAPASEGRLEVGAVRVDRGLVVADVRLVDAFDPETRRSIESGLPITVEFRLEFWRDRRRWFDKQIDARTEAFRIHWDPGDRQFVLTHPGAGPRRDGFDRLSDLLEELSSRSIPLYPRWDLDEGPRYFAILEVAIRPITLEEFRELDGWIRGRIRGDGPEEEEGDEDGSDGGGVTGALFGFLVDLAGFGDTIHRAQTERFRIPDLPIEGPR